LGLVLVSTRPTSAPSLGLVWCWHVPVQRIQEFKKIYTYIFFYLVFIDKDTQIYTNKILVDQFCFQNVKFFFHTSSVIHKDWRLGAEISNSLCLSPDKHAWPFFFFQIPISKIQRTDLEKITEFWKFQQRASLYHITIQPSARNENRTEWQTWPYGITNSR